MSSGGRSASAALRDLAARLPPGSVSLASADRLAASTDLWPRHLIRMVHGDAPELPAGVVWPETVEQVQTIVGHARAADMVLVPYGAGSSVVGGASSGTGDVVVDLKRMASVVAIDGDARVAIAQTGIIGELFERQLNRAGYTQGHFPSSIYCSTLGGWIAARSAGQMSSRYGKIEDQVVGGTVVLADGAVVEQVPTPVRAPLLDELIGSEGTLGIWTEAAVRIHPLPERRLFRAFDFPDLERAVAAARAWLFGGLVPSVMRIYDPLDSLLHRGSHSHSRSDSHRERDRGANKLAWCGATFPRLTSFLGDALAGSCRCVVGFEGPVEIATADMAAAVDIAVAHAARDCGAAAGDAWYATRYAISYGQSNAYRAGVAVDTMEVACPWEKVLGVYTAVRRAGIEAGAQVLAHFSHVYLEGCSIYFTYALPVRGGVAAYERLWQACLRAAVDAGANVSHHHGSGRLKAGVVARTLGGATETVAELRHQYDPTGIMNPGVLNHAASNEVMPLADAPPGDGFVCVAEPGELVAAVESRLNERGRTLGPSARLFAGETVLAAARADHLWRANPQIGVIEAVVWGVDAQVGGRAHRFVPAPRAAIGSDLVHRLLRADVERLWLRCEAPPGSQRWFRGDVEDVLQAGYDLAASPQAPGVGLDVRIAGGSAELRICLPERDPVGMIDSEISRRMAYGCEEIDGVAAALAPIDADGSAFFCGPWRAVEQMCTAADLGDVTVLIPWADPVGVAGFVAGVTSARERRRIAGLLETYGLARSMERRESAPLQTVGHGGAPVESERGAGSPASGGTHLRLLGDGAALDNCTYCPKLCRFSCAVATADGSETLTPRQLMLTANLDRSGGRPLDADGAARLWSCCDCRGCASFCEHGNDVAAVLQRTRAQLLSVGRAPSRVRAYLEAFRRHGRPGDRPVADDAAVVLQGRGDPQGAATWLFLGCQSGRDEVAAAERLLDLCRGAHGSSHVMTGAISCCGHPLWRWGDRRGFRKHARAFADQLRGVSRLVVDDPGCAFALRELYPRVGVAVPPIVTTVELLMKVDLESTPAQPWTLQRPCHSTGALGEASLRSRFSGCETLVAGSVLEGESGCCGGMLLDAFDPTLAARVAERAAGDLLGGGAQRIVSSSPTCRRRLRSAGARVDAAVMLWSV